jgi:cytochrome c-type biogenesis protein CcmH/NrfF
VVAVLALPAGAWAQCPRTSLADVEDEVMCPVCGTPLSLASEAPQARRQRELILDLVEDCRSKAEIKEVLRAEFGDDVLAVPDDEGFELSAWVVPVLVLIAALGGIALAITRWRSAREPQPAAGPPPADDRERLDRDLSRYDL